MNLHEFITARFTASLFQKNKKAENNHTSNAKEKEQPRLTFAMLSGLVIVDSIFLMSAIRLIESGWISFLLVIAAIVNVPVFVITMFLLQTRYRNELQEDKYYSKYTEYKYRTELLQKYFHSLVEFNFDIIDENLGKIKNTTSDDKKELLINEIEERKKIANEMRIKEDTASYLSLDKTDNISDVTSPTLKLNIICIEDDFVSQKVLKLYLSIIGCDAFLVSSGEEFFKRYDENKYDMIIMDVKLPGMNGYEVTKLLRDYEKDKGIRRKPILAVTALAMNEDKNMCLESGMDEYLSKPISIEMLKEKIISISRT